MTKHSTKHVSNDLIHPQALASGSGSTLCWNHAHTAQPHDVSLRFLMLFSSAYSRQFICRYFLASFHSNKYITSLVQFYTVHHHLLPYAALTHMNHIADLCYPCETYSDYVKLYLTWCLHTHRYCTFIYLMESRINTSGPFGAVPSDASAYVWSHPVQRTLRVPVVCLYRTQICQTVSHHLQVMFSWITLFSKSTSTFCNNTRTCYLITSIL